MQMKKKQKKTLALALPVACLISPQAWAINLDIAGGWPCNVWMNQTGAVGAVANTARFNVKESPTATVQSTGLIFGELANYLTSIGKSFNSLIANLPLLEPLDFNLASETFGARMGVDVCVPVIAPTRDDPVSWTVNVSSVGALIPPAEGDWFSVTTPKVTLEILASNCNTAYNSPMSTTSPEKADSCIIDSIPAAGADSLNFVGQTLTYKFRQMASREMALRISLQEQSLAPRPHRWDSGTVNIDLIDDPLPPLLIGDLLGKQLFFAPDPDVTQWPGCAHFSSETGLAFSALNLQGPNSNLDLRWTGGDLDCTVQNGCSNGNKGGNNFSFPATVYLEDGSVAQPTTSPSAKVKALESIFNDFAFSGESVFPANGKIQFQAEFDEVYRNSGKALFSTTVSREVAAGAIGSCRVWFKRDNGFDCDSLPTIRMQDICKNMK
jgi:hypothetical protein